MNYDFDRGRWQGPLPPGVRWSQIVLGTRRAQKQARETGEVIVSAYDVSDGRRFYVPCSGENRAGSGVLYRIRVKVKGDTDDRA